MPATSAASHPSATNWTSTCPRFGASETVSRVDASASNRAAIAAVSSAIRASSSSSACLRDVDVFLRALDVVLLLRRAPEPAGGGGRAPERAGADRLAAEQRAEHGRGQRDPALQLRLRGLLLLALDALCRAPDSFLRAARASRRTAAAAPRPPRRAPRAAHSARGCGNRAPTPRRATSASARRGDTAPASATARARTRRLSATRRSSSPPPPAFGSGSNVAPSAGAVSRSAGAMSRMTASCPVHRHGRRRGSARRRRYHASRRFSASRPRT